MANIAPQPRFRAFDANGDPLAGGKLFTYEAGTVTAKDTYTTAEGDVANANPVILDADGYADVWLGDGGYKFVLKDSADATLWTVDNIGGSSSTAFGGDVNTISTNTVINSVYANSVILASGTISLSLGAASDLGEGFYFSVKNTSSGVITIDPDGAETINGAATLALAENDSALIITNGTAWFSLFLYQDTAKKGTTNTFTAANTFSAAVVFNSTVALNGATTGVTQAQNDNTTTIATTAYVDRLAALMPGTVLNGAVLSNGTDATNDINISAGACISDDGTTTFSVGALVKQLDAAWASGTNAGMRDTGAIANDDWHIYAIYNPSTLASDVIATITYGSPTMPSGYTKKCFLGSIIRASATILGFVQNGNRFNFTVAQSVASGIAMNTTPADLTLIVPTGRAVDALIRARMARTSIRGSCRIYPKFEPDVAIDVDGPGGMPSSGIDSGSGSFTASIWTQNVITNTSGVVRYVGDAVTETLSCDSVGWVDLDLRRIG